MRRSFLVPTAGLALVIAACQDVTDPSGTGTASAPIAAAPAQQAADIVPGRVVVGLREGADAAALAQRNGLVVERVGVSGAYVAFRGAAGNERALAARLGTDADVVWAEPDHLRQTTAIDPKLWAFFNPGGLSVTFTRGRGNRIVKDYLSLDDADEDNVEGYAQVGSPVSIASIDTGVEFSHPEFGAATLVNGRDFYSGDDDSSDTDDHGTHTTGTMVGDNVGVAGVAGAAARLTVYVYRVCGPPGCPTTAIADAIMAATDAGVVAMNLSLSGASTSQAEEDAIQYATDNGAVVIASSGNGGTGTVAYPARNPNAISVAASNWQDELSYYSNWGTGLDLTAPGGELYSNTTDEAGIWSSVRGGYAYFQGTSMAAPQVTGTAAIVASVTGLRGGALRARLEDHADDLGAIGYDTQFGNGRLNSYRSVTLSTLIEGGPPPPPPPPTGSLTASFTYSCSGLDCDFDGNGSTGDITAYEWTFGDGDTGSGLTTSHTYGGADTYTVTLTVNPGPDLTDGPVQGAG